MTDQTFEQRAASAVSTLTVCVIILAVVVGLALAAAGFAVVSGTSAIDTVGAVAHRVSHDEQKTCKIQARGLPASHELAAVIIDLDSLVAFPPTTAAQKQAVAHEPPAERKVVADLKAHLAGYKADEGKQPASRTC